MKNIYKILILAALLTILLPMNMVHADTVDQLLNDLVGPRQQYNTMVSPAYLRNNTTEDYVNPQSGELTLSQTDYVLPGINGLDLEIKRIFKSGTATVFKNCVRIVDGVWVNYLDNNCSVDNSFAQTFYEKRYNLGCGVRFSFPTIENSGSYKFLHSDSGDVYEMEQDPNDIMKYRLKNHPVEDISIDCIESPMINADTDENKFKSQGFYANGDNHLMYASYRMEEKSGKKTFFDAEGRILGIRDRYNNKITFEYVDFMYKNVTKVLISKIIDTAGRVVTIDYNENPTYYTTASDFTKSNLNYNFQVILTFPDNKKIVYDKEAFYYGTDGTGNCVLRTLLHSVYDMDAKFPINESSKKKYCFTYSENSVLGFSYSSDIVYSDKFHYNLLIVNNFKTNKFKDFKYGTFTRSLNTGSEQYTKVIQKTDNACIIGDFDSVKDKRTYTYTNEPDGYGYSGYNGTNEDYLKNTYRYYTEITDLRGAKTKYTYNGLGETVTTEKSGNDHKEVITTTYDNYKLPSKNETCVYNVVNGQVSNTTPVKKIENFEYDSYGNLLSYTGPLADRDENGDPVDYGAHAVKYWYATDRFHVLTCKTWENGNDTTSTILYTVDAYGNVTQEKKTHRENGIDNSIFTDFDYDVHGNMTKKTVYLDNTKTVENSYITNYEYGIDFSSVDQKGACLTREYYNNDNYVSKKYVYDFQTGNLKAEIDRNNNWTRYDYDVLNRLTEVTYPDSTTKQYQYIDYTDKNKEVKYIDPSNNKFCYTYDIFDNLVRYERIIDENSPRILLQRFEYDSNSNKVKDIDANGHSTRFEYDSANRLRKKSFWESDTTEKESISLNYTIGSDPADPDTAVLMSMTDEEGYVTRYYYNIMNWLIKVANTPDNENYYNTTYKYNFLGNKTEMTDARGNSTIYEYDDLMRLTGQKDALGNWIIYSYNRIGKLETKKEPGDKVTEYIYDLLGRTSIVKLYQNGSTDYIYKSYSCDNAGNITNSIEGQVVDEADTISSDVSYTYNSMNRVTDKRVKIDSTRTGHIQYTYDNLGNKTSEKDFINAIEDKYTVNNYVYDFAGRVIEESGSVENEGQQGYYLQKHYYDSNNNLIKDEVYSNANSFYTTTYSSYDFRNRLEQKVQPYGTSGDTKTTQFSYDKKGNLTTQTLTKQGEQCVQTYGYDGMGRLIRSTDPLGYTTRYVYDAVGNKIKEIDPRYYSVSGENANSNIINSLPQMQFEYDKLNRLVKTSAFDGTTLTVISYKEYDGRGNLVKDVDGEGYNSSVQAYSIGGLYEYDVADRVVKYTSAATVKYNQTNSQNKVTKKNTYDGSGRLLSTEDAEGNKVTNSYYLNGKLKDKEYPDFSKESYEYDLIGRNIETYTNRASGITKTYNTIFNKPYKIEYPDGKYETFSYDYMGRKTVYTDRSSGISNYDYDPDGNMVTETNDIEIRGSYMYKRILRYTYDEANNLLSKETFLNRKSMTTGYTETTESAGDRTTYTYDKANRLTKMSTVYGRETNNIYDQKGNLITQKTKVSDAYDDVKRYTYDLLSKMVTETTLVESADIDLSNLPSGYSDSEYASRVKASATYDYYKNGLLKSKNDPYGNVTSFEYNLDGKVTKTTYPGNKEITYTYDFRGNMTEEKNKFSTYYEYDNLGQLIRKKSPDTDGGQAITRYIYDAMGNKEKEISPVFYDASKDTSNLVSTMAGVTYDYDVMNRLQSVSSPEGDILEYRQYDENGNLIKVVDGLRYTGDIDTSSGQTSTYDYLNRLTQTTDALGNSIVYEYDVLGNITKKTDAMGNSTSYEYNPDGTVHIITFPDTGIVEYTYDKLGRKITEKDQLGNTTTYTYNAFGKESSVKDALDYTVHNKYDFNGNLSVITDKRGNVSRLTYDSRNRLKEKKVPIDRDTSNNIIYAVERYEYDDVGNISKKTVTGTLDALDKRETNYTYYNNNLLNTVTDSSGSYTKNYYDSNNNLIKVETLRDTGIYDISKFEYDNRDRMIKSIKLVDEADIYNAANMPNIANIRDTEYPGKVQLITGYEYDILGNKTMEIDPRAYGDTQNQDQYSQGYNYDSLNRLIRKYDVTGGNNKQYYYDGNGNKTRERNERGYNTYFTYDTLNRLKTVKDALDKVYTYNYDVAGNKTSETDAKNNTITYTYDKLNRLDTVKDAYDVIIKKIIYDENGNKIKEIDAKGYQSGTTDATRYGTEYTYDLGNRLVKIVDPEVKVLNDESKYTAKYEYDQYGEKTKSYDGLGIATQYEYDNAGRLLRVTDATGYITRYAYDKAGNKVSMVDGRGKTTTYSYGAFGILKTVTKADDTSESYKYDLSLNKVNTLNGNGKSIVYTFDLRNQLLSKSVTGTTEMISYAYDAAGNRSSMTDDAGTSTYSYDKNDRLLSITKAGVADIVYTYDDAGNVASVTDKKGNCTSYTYDKSNRIYETKYSVSGVSKTITYSYDANGNRSSIVYQGGVSENYTYDRNSRLRTLVNKKPDNTVISRYTYTYDITGKQKTKTDGNVTTNYTYDETGRIMQIDAPGKTTVYTYDGAGNRTALNETYTSDQSSSYIDKATGNDIQYILKNSEYIYSDTNLLLKLTERMKNSGGTEVLRKVTSYHYDKNGNQIQQDSEYIVPLSISTTESFNIAVYADDSTTFDSNSESVSNTFDSFDRLTSVEVIQSGTRTITDFTYNGDDLRTKKIVKSSSNGYVPQETDYIYDRQHVILEMDASSNVKARYIRGVNYLARIDGANKHSYFLYNGHGDVTQTVSEEGVIENQYDYDIFGNPTLTIEQYSCAIRYAGEFYDAESGMYYLRARYYNAYIGRFISEDSYWGEDTNPLSLNLYTYAENDPIQFVDPTGHFPYDTVLKPSQTKDDDVAQMQRMLQSITDGKNKPYLGKIPINQYGIFGPLTLAAVNHYKSDRGLGNIPKRTEGLVGYETWTYMECDYNIEDIKANAPEPVQEFAITSEYEERDYKITKYKEYLKNKKNNGNPTNDPVKPVSNDPVKQPVSNDPIIPVSNNPLKQENITQIQPVSSYYGQDGKFAVGQYTIGTGNIVMYTPIDMFGKRIDVDKLTLEQQKFYWNEYIRLMGGFRLGNDSSFNFNLPTVDQINYEKYPVYREIVDGIRQRYADYIMQSKVGQIKAVVGMAITGISLVGCAMIAEAASAGTATPLILAVTGFAEANGIFYGASMAAEGIQDWYYGANQIDKKGYNFMSEGVFRGNEALCEAYMTLINTLSLGTNISGGIVALQTSGSAINVITRSATYSFAKSEVSGNRNIVDKLTEFFNKNKLPKEETGKTFNNGGVLDNANFAQKKFNAAGKFSDGGIEYWEKTLGRRVETMDELKALIKSGEVKVSQVPIDYVVRDGNTLILNTRSSQVLTELGIPRSQWNAVNRTGQELYETNLTNQLTRNKLTSEGVPYVVQSGK